jgi:hypothetical protein
MIQVPAAPKCASGTDNGHVKCITPQRVKFDSFLWTNCHIEINVTNKACNEYAVKFS